MARVDILQIGAMLISVLLMILPIGHMLAILIPATTVAEWNLEAVFQFVLLCTGSTLTFVSGVLLLVGVLTQRSVLVLPAIVNTVGNMNTYTYTFI
jgi:hypothetical protein